MLNLGCLGYCTPPPEIENAEAAHNNFSEIGDNVLYACLDGFTKVGGNSRLTCALAVDNTAVWTGTHIKCNNTEKKCDNIEKGIWFKLKVFS